jgi:hypothetical protein
VDQLQIRHLAAVAIGPLHLPQEHVPDASSITARQASSTRCRVY